MRSSHWACSGFIRTERKQRTISGIPRASFGESDSDVPKDLFAGEGHKVRLKDVEKESFCD